MPSNDVIAQNFQDLSNLYLLQSILGNIQTNLELVSEGGAGRIISMINPNLFQLAAQYYGDATQWTTIANANNIKDPIFTGGEIFNIKVLAGGNNYSSSTSIQILGEEVRPAIVLLQIDHGVIVSANIAVGGFYGTLPIAQITDSTGSGAVLEVSCIAKLTIPQSSTASGGLLNFS